VSLQSVRQPGGTEFADGATADGIGYRRVLGFQGTLQLDAPSTLRWIRPSGATEGDVVLSDGAVEQTIAKHVTDFAVTRSGDTFAVRVAVRMGPQDDRGRVARGTVSVQPRNP
jgi:hypothetical protein